MNHRFFPSIIVGLSFSALSLMAAPPFKNWGYWLTQIDPEVVHQSEYDMVVIDYSVEGINEFSPADVQHMKARDHQPDRTVISYFSIGEAEEYRYYWNNDWRKNPPSWLDEENPDWPGNYKVKYWEPGWQAILYGNHDAYLDKIISAGFDGVYLDIIDAFEYFEERRPTAMQEMIDLVINMADYARKKNPNFLFITQNGERVLEHERLLAIIDGAAKEDLYFGLEGDSIPAPEHETEYSLQYLKKAAEAGKFVLLASYVPEPEGQKKVLAGSRQHGFIPYFGTRELDQLLKDSGKGLRPYAPPLSLSSDFERNFTPGNFYLSSLPKNRWRYTITVENFEEKSVFEERDETGALTFSENVRFEERQIRVGAEYGVTEHFELGLVIPFVETELNLQEIGGDQLRSTDEDSGVGNLTLTADLSHTLSDENDVYALLASEIAFPTDTQKEDLKSQGSAQITGTLEKFWGPLGIAASVGARYTGEDGLKDGDTIFTWSAGPLIEFSDRLFLSATAGQEDDTNIVEGTLEWLTSRTTSIELFGGTTVNGEDAWFGGLSFNMIH